MASLTGDLEVPRVDFSAADLVQVNLQVNNARLFNVLQSVMKVLGVVLQKMSTVEQTLESVQKQVEAQQGEFDGKLTELGLNFTGKIDGLRKETRRELDVIKDAKDERSTQLMEEVVALQARLKQTKEELHKELAAVAKRPEEIQEQLGRQIAEMEESLGGTLKKQEETFSRDIAANRTHLDGHGARLAQCETDVGAMYGVLEMDPARTAKLSKHSSEMKLGYLNEVPIFASMQESLRKERGRADGKFDNVHKRMGAIEQALGKKADQRDLDELRDTMDHEEVDRIVQRHNEQIAKLFTLTDATEKALAVGMEKKADRDRLQGVEEDIDTLEARVREIFDSAGNTKWQQLLMRVEELDHYTQKLDRRKVGRSDMQRMAKRLRQQILGDAGDDE
eukprot:RCo027404